jgi:hypothetical protein
MKKKVRVRRFWAIKPITRVVPDKTKKPWRKLKHKPKLLAD